MVEEPNLDAEEERLYDNARTLEFGDWNYPVIEAHRPSREDRMYADPNILTASTNRNLLQPTKENKRRRKSQIQDLQESVDKGKQRDQSSTGESSRSKSSHSKSRAPFGNLLRQKSSSSSSAKSDKSQLVDLVVEDHQAEEVDRVRARKEGGPGWNEVPSKHFVKTYEPGEEEEVREGFNPDEPEPQNPEAEHNLNYAFTENQSEEEQRKHDIKPHIVSEANHWETRDVSNQKTSEEAEDHPSPSYGSFREERNAWNAD